MMSCLTVLPVPLPAAHPNTPPQPSGCS
jgi:hypothetical protein